MYIYQQYSDYHQIIRLSRVRLSGYQIITVWVLSAWRFVFIGHWLCLLLNNSQKKSIKKQPQYLKEHQRSSGYLVLCFPQELNKIDGIIDGLTSLHPGTIKHVFNHFKHNQAHFLRGE